MASLRVGDQVHFDGAVRRVVGITGTLVRIESEGQPPSTLLLVHLLTAPDFELVDGVAAERLSLVCHQLDDVAPRHAERARRWECHIVEIVTGLPPDAAPGASPRPEYDPATRSLIERDLAKATELTAAGTPTTPRQVKRMRLRYRHAGVRGLVDGRAFKLATATGRVDPRIVTALRAAIAQETDKSTGTRRRLLNQTLDDLRANETEGLIEPSWASLYRLVAKLSTGRHTFGAATTRRSLANRPPTPFGTSWAARPGQQVQIDTTVLDILAIHVDGQARRVELTVAVDLATRTICAAILRPVGTKAVDASLLLAKMLVPEPMRPNWSHALRMSASRLPFDRLADVDRRMNDAAAKPVIVAESITCDRGKIYLSQNFLSSCQALGISVQPAHAYTPTDKAVVERTLGSISTLFCERVAGYTGRDPTRRGRRIDEQALWSVAQLQELLDEWIVSGWQSRPHDGLFHPDTGQVLSPNEMYAHLVAAAGYLPLPLGGDDYIELLPQTWRTIRPEGVRILNRTYDGNFPYRGEHSGVNVRRGLWEVHYDPYDLSQVWVRNHRDNGEWISATWRYAEMVSAPFSDYLWRAAQDQARHDNGPRATEEQTARALDDLLRRAELGPTSQTPGPTAAPADPKALPRGRVPGRRTSGPHRPPGRTAATPRTPTHPAAAHHATAHHATAHHATASTEPDPTVDAPTSTADVTPMEVLEIEVLDVLAEAERWR